MTRIRRLLGQGVLLGQLLLFEKVLVINIESNRGARSSLLGWDVMPNRPLLVFCSA